MKTILSLSLVLMLGLAGVACKKSNGQNAGDGVEPLKPLRIVPYRSGERWGFSDPAGKILLEPKYEYVYLLDDGYGRFSDGTNLGLLSPEGKVLLQPKYLNIGFFRNDRALFQVGESSFGYLGPDGQVAIAPVYEEAYDFQHNRAVVKKNGQFLLIDRDGGLIKSLGNLQPFYDEPFLSQEERMAYDSNFMLVQQPETFLTGLADSKGSILIKPTYQYLSHPINGAMVAQMGEKFGLLRTDGSAITPRTYLSLYRLGPNRYAASKDNERTGVIDATGKVVIPFEYGSLSAGPEGHFIAYRSEKAGLLNADGATVLPFEYSGLFEQQGLLVATDQQSRVGVINAKGEVLLPLEYEAVEILSPTRFLADKGGKRGLIDHKGKWIIQPVYDPTYLGSDEHEYEGAMNRSKTCFILFKEGQGTLFNLDGKPLSNKKWLYCGSPDAFGLTQASDANSRDNYIGPDGTIYAKDPALKKVTVRNAQELYDAIANDTEITLEDGKYDLSSVSGESDHAAIFDFGFEDRTILIREVRNLHIKARNPRKAELITPFAYIPVLKITNSYNVSLTGLTMGHDIQPGLCDGAVIAPESVVYLTVDNCDLYGSGTYGIQAMACTNVQVRNTTIRECTAGILSMENCSFCYFADCRMFDNKGYDMVNLSNAYEVVFDKVQFRNNHSEKEYGPYHFFRFEETYQKYILKDCTFTDCSSNQFASFPEMIDQQGVKIERSNFGR